MGGIEEQLTAISKTQTWDGLIETYKQDPRPAFFKIASLAQWIIESARGTSALAKFHLNYGGIKWREELKNVATPVDYAAHDGTDKYCKFISNRDFIEGYWLFIGRKPYVGWEQTKTAEEYIHFITSRGYAEDPRYIEKVINALPEAAQLLGFETPEKRVNRAGDIISGVPATTRKEIEQALIPNAPHIYPHSTQFVPDADRGGIMPFGKPQAIVIHYTVSYNASGTIEFFLKNGVDVHFVIGHQGEIIQMVECNRAAAHAGESFWNGLSSLNDKSIGIEVVNIGPLVDDGKGLLDAYNDEKKRKGLPFKYWEGSFRARNGKGHRFWEPFTAPQEQAVMEICAWAMKEYDIPLSNVIGHYECAPTRKVDPWGSFSMGDMSKFREALKAHIFTKGNR